MSKLKYGIGTVSAIAAFVGVAGLSPSQGLAGEQMGTTQGSDLGMQQQSWITERAKNEYALQKQECDTLKNSQPQAYEPCLQKAQSTRDNLLAQTQGSEHAGQGSQGFASDKSQQSGQEKGPIDKMTSAVKETVAEVKEFFGASDQGREGQQPGQSMGQGQQGGVTQGANPLQQGFEARHGQDFAQQSSGADSGQGGQNFGQQGTTQGQQFYGQQGQSGQGSFQGGQQPQGQSWQQGTGGQQGQSGQGSFQGGQQPQGQSGQGSFQGGQQQPQGQYGQQGTDGSNQQFQGQQGQSGQGQGSFQGGQQQPQTQSWQQGTGGTNQQFQSGGTQGLQGSSNQQGGSTTSSGWIGAKQGAHMDRGEYYQALALEQYVTLTQECNTLKQDPNIYDQCQKHAESTRDKIAGMAGQGT